MKVVALIACLLATCYAGHQEAAQQSLLCDVCEFVGDEVNKRILTDDSKKLIISVATTLCSELPIFAKECTDAVEEHGQDLVDELFNMFDVDKICAEAHLCTSTVEYPAFFQLGEGEACRACIDGLDMVKTLISSDDMKDMLHVIVNETCLAIGGDVASCENLVDTIIDQILGNLVPMFDVESLCAQAGACPASLAKPCPYLAALKDGGGCKACMDALALVEQILKSPETLDLVNIAVDETCKAIGGTAVDTCKSIITGILDPIITNLVAIFDPASLCKQAGACAKLQNTKWEGGIFCDACVDSLLELQNIVEDHETEEVLDQLTEIICNAIQTPFCKAIFGTIIKEAFEDVESLNPNVTCADLGACTSFTPIALETEEKVGDTCSECTLIANLLLKELQDASIQAEVEAALDELCVVLPIPNCKDTIHKYLSEIEAILKDLDGKTLCSDIGLCSSRKKEVVVAEVVPKKVGDECSECTLIAGEIITLLKDEEVDSLIKEAIGEFCALLKLPVAMCGQVLDQYFDELIALIKNLDGKTLCSLLGLC